MTPEDLTQARIDGQELMLSSDGDDDIDFVVSDHWPASPSSHLPTISTS